MSPENGGKGPTVAWELALLVTLGMLSTESKGRGAHPESREFRGEQRRRGTPFLL